MKIKTVIIITLLLIVWLFLVPEKDNVSAEVTCTPPLASNCAYPKTVSHVVEDLNCYDPGDFWNWFYYGTDYWNGDPNKLSTLNYFNADDHPAFIGDSQTVRPGNKFVFTAPSSVTSSGDKVKGFWIRMHDNEDNANYTLWGCNVNESGENCSSGWYLLKSDSIHTSGDPGVEPCSNTLKADAAHDGCPDREPPVPACDTQQRADWACAISYDEHRWDNGS